MAGSAQLLIEAFENRFHKTPDVYRAPGRVNLIGEHTDYNLGFVMPIAIDLACYAASAPNGEGVLRVFSKNLEEGREWPTERIARLQPAGDWSDYIIGVARQIPQTRGRDLMIYGTVPVGSGLSSSASLEVSTALALGWERGPKDELERSNLELAKLCQRAENEFVGVPSGIMDQYCCVFGREGAAVKIDCRSLEHEDVALPRDAAIVTVNSMVKHALGQSAYRERVAECARAAEAMGHGLRDARPEELDRVADPVARRRARHVISEDQRVIEFAQACREGDLGRMGELLLASHRSLQTDYEVSCAELDFLVDTAAGLEGVYGARMTGGGFGGCTVNLVRPDAVASVERELKSAYEKHFGKTPEFHSVKPTEGAQKIS